VLRTGRDYRLPRTLCFVVIGETALDGLEESLLLGFGDQLAVVFVDLAEEEFWVEYHCLFPSSLSDVLIF
jgi:hypothetical protein